MTQLEELEKQILANIKKIRQKTLRKFLVKLAFNIKPYVDSRRAKHDYKLAIETLGLILNYHDLYIQTIGSQNPELLKKAMRKALED